MIGLLLRRWCRVAWLLGLTLSCGVHHVRPYVQKIREYKTDQYAASDAARTPGSLWSEGAYNLFEDAKARRVGDIITIRVDERSDATRGVNTNTQHQADVEMGISNFLKAITLNNPGLNPANLVSATTANNFTGKGNTASSGALSATLPVRIKNTLPNGDFFIEGNKVFLLNNEESFLYISGVVRPIDIQPDNSVSSSLLADVELEYTGRGVLSEADDPGWLARALHYVWPF